jgi:cell division septation protein DedD
MSRGVKNMNYDFSFNKKTISFLLGGFVFVGAMLFVAGLLVGATLKAEPTATAAVNAPAPQPASTTQAPAPEPAPKEPVLKAEATKPVEPPPVETAAPSAAPTPVKQAHSVASMVESRESRESRRPLPAPMREAADGDVRIIQRADASAAEADDANKLTQLSFSVQVGVFMDEKEANQLVRQLQAKGYTPIVLTANDDEHRQWYAVRIGAYATRTEAAQAAINIAKQEQIKAVVRPLGSL